MASIAESPNSKARKTTEFGGLLSCKCGGAFAEQIAPLRCDSCGTKIDSHDGILLARPEKTLHDEIARVQEQEERTRDQQAKFYDAWLALHFPSHLEGQKIKRAVNRTSGSSALEIGCGTGRLTKHLARRFDTVVAVDRSFTSLTHCRERLKAAGLAHRVLLIHADISEIPVRSNSFSLVVMAQVLQHLPTQEIRTNTMADIARYLSPQGRFILSAYEWSRFGAMGRKKVGFHAGGIYYHRFTKAELVELMAPHLEVRDVRSCMGQLLVSISEKPDK